jgi:hypothetical protein
MTFVALRRWAAVAILALILVFELGNARSLFDAGQRALGACFVFFAMTVAITAVALARRAYWARPLALGIALTGYLDMVTWVAVVDLGSSFPRGLLAFWGFVLQAVPFTGLCLTLFLLLCGRAMRAHLATAPWTELWRRDDWRLRRIDHAIVGVVPAVAALVRYASTGAWWVGGDDRAIALGAALALAAGGIAALAGRAVGVLLMFAGACAALGLATETMFRLATPLSGGYHARDGVLLSMAVASIVPASLLAFAAMAALLRPMLRAGTA